MKKRAANIYVSLIQNKLKRRLIRDILTNRHGRDTALPTALGASRPHASIIPPPEPEVAAMVKERAPYGQRRVAILTNVLLDWDTKAPRHGGGERYALNIARLLARFGFEVHFYQAGHAEFDGEYYGFPVYALPMEACYSEFHHGVCDQFCDRTREYDHVYYNMPEYSSGRMRSDAIMTCHGIWFDHNNYGSAVSFREHEWFRHLGKVFSQPRKIVSVDSTSIDTIRTFWPELTSNMTFIPNFADPELFHPDFSRRSGERIRILFPRRSHVNRGSRILGDILKAIPHDVDINWVGEGDAQDTEIIKALAREDSRLKYHAAAFDEMPGWYQMSDISVVPTIACEGTSLSLIESLACGCATIATHVGGLSDLMIDGYNGIVTDPTAEQIALAINKLIEDRELRHAYQRRALESAAHFSLENWRKKWINVLLEQDWISREQALQSGMVREQELIPQKPGRKLLILTRNAIHGGVESLIAQEARYLDAEVVVCGGHDEKATTPFAYTRADNKAAVLHKLAGHQKVLYHWIPDYALDALQESGITCVEFVHRTDLNNCDRPIADAYITHSRFLADYVREKTGKGCAIAPHAIDSDTFVPAETVGRYIGGVTSYSKVKGIDYFIRAWAETRARYPHLKARFYGQGEELDELRALSDRLGAEVEFLPPTAHAHTTLKEFRCVVSPSRFEGMPVTILESLAMNIPVIASDLSGMEEFYHDARERGVGDAIHLIRPGDLDDLKEKIHRVLTSPPGQPPRPYIRQRYSPQEHCKSISDLFSTLAHGCPA